MNKILIEVVSNGFIVTEDYREYHEQNIRIIQAEIPVIKVFNTKKQLNKYINENLKIEKNE